MSSLTKSIESNKAPKAIGPYSQAVALQHPHKLLFVSGQLPVDPATGKLIEGDIQEKTKRSLENIQAILAAGGSSLEHVVRVDIFCTNLKNDFPLVNQVYSSFFQGSVKPARQTVEVSRLPMDAAIEISCIAVIP